MKRILAFILCFFATMTPSLAKDECNCDTAIINAAYDIRKTMSKTDRDYFESALACSMTYKEYIKKRDEDANFKGKFSLEAGKDEESFKKERTEHCSSNTLAEARNNLNQYVQKTVNKATLSAWENCKKTCKSSSNLRCWISTAPDYGTKSSYATLSIYWGETRPANVIGTSIVPGKAFVEDSFCNPKKLNYIILPQNHVLSGRATRNCTVRSYDVKFSSPLTITVRTGQGAAISDHSCTVDMPSTNF